MLKSHPKKEDQTLRPVGIALAAVETHARAPLEPVANEKTYLVDPTNHPGFEEDPSMVIGQSDPTAPFGKR